MKRDLEVVQIGGVVDASTLTTTPTARVFNLSIDYFTKKFTLGFIVRWLCRDLKGMR